MHFLKVLTGLNSASGLTYLFWSGFAGNLTMFGGIIVWYRHHNCHEDKCLWIGHPDATGRVVCKKHIKIQ